MHTVKVTMIANQEICVNGQDINIYDIETIVVNEYGIVTHVHMKKETKKERIITLHNQPLKRKDKVTHREMEGTFIYMCEGLNDGNSIIVSVDKPNKLCSVFTNDIRPVKKTEDDKDKYLKSITFLNDELEHKDSIIAELNQRVVRLEVGRYNIEEFDLIKKVKNIHEDTILSLGKKNKLLELELSDIKKDKEIVKDAILNWMGINKR
jgi:hypothetical protein